jgi:hypothetical protein
MLSAHGNNIHPAHDIEWMVIEGHFSEGVASSRSRRTSLFFMHRQGFRQTDIPFAIRTDLQQLPMFGTIADGAHLTGTLENQETNRA